MTIIGTEVTAVTAPGVRTDPRSEFLFNMILIDDLRRFGSTASTTLNGETLSLFAAAERRALETIQGRLAVQKWLGSYARPLALMERYRASLINGVHPDGSELEQVAEASHVALNALHTRLSRIDAA